MAYPLEGIWTYPTEIRAGAGRVAELPVACRALGLTRPLLVSDRGLADHPMIREALGALRAAGLEAGLFADVQGNPTDRNLADGIKAYHAGAHDGVVAFGGGSAMDVGKLVALMQGQSIPVWDLEDIGDWWTRADADAIAPIVAVPTTAGTGSEVGRAAVLTNSQDLVKKIIFHPRMLPSIVIGDPELALGLPPALTAATGMDAFTHSFETYCVERFHPMADAIALESLRLISETLPVACRDGADVEARMRMFAAAMMGGVAFQKGLGAVHSLAHPLGALYDVQHGLANAVILPYVVAFNRPAIEAKVEVIAHHLRIKGGFAGFMDWLLRFREGLGIPHRLADLGLDGRDADAIAAKALDDPSTASNPRPLTHEDFRDLYLAALSGELPAG
ncbi:iron-containing alcohol dehydrogenase [Roseovarius spongiae]|uniref:Alcohol dehydrogenase 2 n=1 Tax=Roseovarius spongiae TaxID=2320272 RepID=A0A3A8AUH0_9RHOB|nr:iron-containing alcohol dehydrogenase [Roseovarius spongiae]RKF15309.1 iron-containing alcohol dehydrogenase [Roseovarius spongiae]